MGCWRNAVDWVRGSGGILFLKWEKSWICQKILGYEFMKHVGKA